MTTYLKSQNTPFHEEGLNFLPARTAREQAFGPLIAFLQIHQPSLRQNFKGIKKTALLSQKLVRLNFSKYSETFAKRPFSANRNGKHKI